MFRKIMPVANKTDRLVPPRRQTRNTHIVDPIRFNLHHQITTKDLSSHIPSENGMPYHRTL